MTTFTDWVGIVLLILATGVFVALVASSFVGQQARASQLRAAVRGEGRSAADVARLARRRSRALMVGGIACAVGGFTVAANLTAESRDRYGTVVAAIALGGTLLGLAGGIRYGAARRVPAPGPDLRRFFDEASVRDAIAIQRLAPKSGRQRLSIVLLLGGALLVVVGVAAFERARPNPGQQGPNPWVVLFDAGLVALAAGAWARGRATRQAWSQWATRGNGWRYWPKARDVPTHLSAWLNAPAPLNRLEPRNVVAGRIHGVRFITCQAGRIGGLRDQFHLACVEMPASSRLLTVRMRRHVQAGDFHRRVGLEGQEFTDLFEVHSDDRFFASKVLHVRALELVQGLGPSLTWVWQGNLLWVARAGPTRPSEALELLPAALAFRSTVPPFVQTEAGRPPPAS